MSDRHVSKELHARQEEILREHVDDLPAGMIAKTVAEAAATVTAGHSDIDDFVKIVDDVDTRLSGDGGPLGLLESHGFGKLDRHVASASGAECPPLFKVSDDQQLPVRSPPPFLPMERPIPSRSPGYDRYTAASRKRRSPHTPCAANILCIQQSARSSS